MNNLYKQKVISEINNSTYFLKRHLLALVNLYRPISSMPRGKQCIGQFLQPDKQKSSMITTACKLLNFHQLVIKYYRQQQEVSFSNHILKRWFDKRSKNGAHIGGRTSVNDLTRTMAARWSRGTTASFLHCMSKL